MKNFDINSAFGFVDNLNKDGGLSKENLDIFKKQLINILKENGVSLGFTGGRISEDLKDVIRIEFEYFNPNEVILNKQTYNKFDNILKENGLGSNKSSILLQCLDNTDFISRNEAIKSLVKLNNDISDKLIELRTRNLDNLPAFTAPLSVQNIRRDLREEYLNTHFANVLRPTNKHLESQIKNLQEAQKVISKVSNKVGASLKTNLLNAGVDVSPKVQGQQTSPSPSKKLSPPLSPKLSTDKSKLVSEFFLEKGQNYSQNIRDAIKNFTKNTENSLNTTQLKSVLHIFDEYRTNKNAVDKIANSKLDKAIKLEFIKVCEVIKKEIQPTLNSRF